MFSFFYSYEIIKYNYFYIHSYSYARSKEITCMNSNYVYDTHRLMSDKNINLAFSGNFTPELITSMLFMAKKNIAKSVTMKKVYNVMIECLENLTKHGQQEENTDKKHPAIFIFGNDDHSYYLATGNTVKPEEVESLKEKIDKANSLDRKGLREWYNQILMGDEGVSDRGGAGLGIIDIAMKSGNPLEYEFRDLDTGFNFFILKVKVDIK